MNSRNSAANRPAPMEAPRSVFAGAWIAVVECTIGLGYGVFLMIRDFQGYEDPGAVISGWGTALWFYFIFGAVLAGAVFLLMGNRWGRGPIVMRKSSSRRRFRLLAHLHFSSAFRPGFSA